MVGPNAVPEKAGTDVISSIAIVTPPHCAEYIRFPTKTKECTPGVVSPPVAATWMVLRYQSNPSGVPCSAGPVM